MGIITCASVALTIVCQIGMIVMVVELCKENNRLKDIINSYNEEIDKINKYLKEITDKTDCVNEEENEER